MDKNQLLQRFKYAARNVKPFSRAGARGKVITEYDKHAARVRKKGLHMKQVTYPAWMNEVLKEISEETKFSINDLFVLSTYLTFVHRDEKYKEEKTKVVLEGAKQALSRERGWNRKTK